MNNYKIAHSMIRVQNLEDSLDFYKNALGFHETRRKEHPESKFDLVYLSDPDELFELELTYNYDHGPYEIGDGYGHMAVLVDDLEESHKRHQEQGYDVTELKGLVKGRKNYYFIKDPDGYKIEVIQAEK